MSPTLIVEYNEDEHRKVTAFLEGLRNRLDGPTGHDQIQDILLKHLEPLVERERAILEPHNKSGALSGSLIARKGTGDLPGTVSVFSAPTATNTMLMDTWGLRGRMQQKNKLASMGKFKGRKRVFYGTIVHQGHGNAAPVPFASQAVEALGEQATEAAAADILKLITGEESSNG